MAEPTTKRRASAGTGKRHTRHNTDSAAIRTIGAKRASVSIKALRQKVEDGTYTGEERALLRLGKSNTRILMGVDDLSDWTDEELRQGHRIGETSGGRRPVVVPKKLHDELVRRTLSKAEEMLRDNLVAAVETLTSLVTDPSVEPKDRLKATQMIMDRVMGKEPTKIEHSGETPWQQALSAGIVPMTGEALGASDPDAEEDDGEDDDDES